jgi:hypothetical protein
MPVVTPSAASMDTVKAVPVPGAVARWPSGGSFNRSTALRGEGQADQPAPKRVP